MNREMIQNEVEEWRRSGEPTPPDPKKYQRNPEVRFSTCNRTAMILTPHRFPASALWWVETNSYSLTFAWWCDNSWWKQFSNFDHELHLYYTNNNGPRCVNFFELSPTRVLIPICLLVLFFMPLRFEIPNQYPSGPLLPLPARLHNVIWCVFVLTETLCTYFHMLSSLQQTPYIHQSHIYPFPTHIHALTLEYSSYSSEVHHIYLFMQQSTRREREVNFYSPNFNAWWINWLSTRIILVSHEHRSFSQNYIRASGVYVLYLWTCAGMFGFRRSWFSSVAVDLGYVTLHGQAGVLHRGFDIILLNFCS